MSADMDARARARHLIKRIVFPLLPQGLQEFVDRRFYYRRLAGGQLSMEPEFELLPDLVHEGEIAVDVGANLGGYAIELSRLVGPRGRVYCLEPVGRTFRLLTSNLDRLARYRNFEAHQVAAAERMGTAEIRIPLEARLPNYYIASLRPSAGPTRSERVRLVALDDWLPRDERPVTFLKIDVEGAELDVLNGARAILTTHHPTVLCEIAFGGVTPARPDVFMLLGSLGYRAFRYRGGGLVMVEGPDRIQDPNYLFVADRHRPRVRNYLVDRS